MAYGARQSRTKASPREENFGSGSAGLGFSGWMAAHLVNVVSALTQRLPQAFHRAHLRTIRRWFFAVPRPPAWGLYPMLFVACGAQTPIRPTSPKRLSTNLGRQGGSLSSLPNFTVRSGHFFRSRPDQLKRLVLANRRARTPRRRPSGVPEIASPFLFQDQRISPQSLFFVAGTKSGGLSIFGPWRRRVRSRRAGPTVVRARKSGCGRSPR